MKLLKGTNLLFVITITLCAVVFVVKYFVEEESKTQFRQVYYATAVVEYYASTMGTTYIHYSYQYNNLRYEGKSQTQPFMVDKIPIGTSDLQIEYAINAPELSKIVDERFK